MFGVRATKLTAVVAGLLLAACASGGGQSGSRPNDVATGTIGGLVATLVCFGLARDPGCAALAVAGTATGVLVQKRRDELVRLRERSEAELLVYKGGYNEVTKILVTQGNQLAQLRSQHASLQDQRAQSERRRTETDQRVNELRKQVQETREVTKLVHQELESTNRQIRELELQTGGNTEQVERKIKSLNEMRARMVALLDSARYNEEQFQQIGKLLPLFSD